MLDVRFQGQPTLDVSGVEILRSLFQATATVRRRDAVDKCWITAKGDSVVAFHHCTRLFASVDTTILRRGNLAATWPVRACTVVPGASATVD